MSVSELPCDQRKLKKVLPRESWACPNCDRIGFRLQTDGKVVCLGCKTHIDTLTVKEVK